MTYTESPVPKNVAGRISFVLGVATVALGLVFTVVQATVIAARNVELLGALSAVHIGIVALIAIGAVVTGIIGLTRAGLPRAMAAAGTALGASALVGVFSSLLTPLLLGILDR